MDIIHDDLLFVVAQYLKLPGLVALGTTGKVWWGLLSRDGAAGELWMRCLPLRLQGLLQRNTPGRSSRLSSSWRRTVRDIYSHTCGCGCGLHTSAHDAQLDFVSGKDHRKYWALKRRVWGYERIFCRAFGVKGSHAPLHPTGGGPAVDSRERAGGGLVLEEQWKLRGLATTIKIELEVEGEAEANRRRRGRSESTLDAPWPFPPHDHDINGINGNSIDEDDDGKTKAPEEGALPAVDIFRIVAVRFFYMAPVMNAPVTGGSSGGAVGGGDCGGGSTGGGGDGGGSGERWLLQVACNPTRASDHAIKFIRIEEAAGLLSSAANPSPPPPPVPLPTLALMLGSWYELRSGVGDNGLLGDVSHSSPPPTAAAGAASSSSSSSPSSSSSSSSTSTAVASSRSRRGAAAREADGVDEQASSPPAAVEGGALPEEEEGGEKERDGKALDARHFAHALSPPLRDDLASYFSAASPEKLLGRAIARVQQTHAIAVERAEPLQTTERARAGLEWADRSSARDGATQPHGTTTEAAAAADATTRVDGRVSAGTTSASAIAVGAVGRSALVGSAAPLNAASSGAGGEEEGGCGVATSRSVKKPASELTRIQLADAAANRLIGALHRHYGSFHSALASAQALLDWPPIAFE